MKPTSFFSSFSFLSSSLSPSFSLSLSFLFLLLPLLLLTTPPTTAQLDPAIPAAIQTNGRARVLITLHDPAPLDAPATQRASAVAQAQSAVLNQLGTADFQLLHRYTYVAGLAATINQQALNLLQQHPTVAAIHLDQRGSGHLDDSVPALQADVIQTNYGITGDNVRVAILDSGAIIQHPDLVGSFIAQHCFTDGDCPPDDTDESIVAQDEHGHGTNVTGIVTSAGVSSHAGFAPDSDILAVRVLDRHNSGWVSDWIAGLDWVYARINQHNVRIVNMSLGTWQLYPGNCNAQQPLLGNAVSQVRALGVTIFASTGNEGSPTSIAAPACLTGVIAVGATYDSDLGREPNAGTYAQYFGGNWPPCYDEPATLSTITCFTNSNSLVDIVAPGARITSSGIAGGSSIFVGTSQATATATGIAALLLEANPNLTPTEIETILESTGAPLLDPKNGRTIPRIHALNALLSLGIPALNLTGPTTGVIQTAYTFTATIPSPTTATPITYTWHATGQSPITATTGLSHSHTYTWASPGLKTIQVTAANINGAITTTHTITLAPAAVTLTGPTLGYIDTPYAFTAAFAPITTTLPFTYTWQATHQSTITQTAGLQNTAVFTWTLTGPATITVTLQNPHITISQTHPLTLYSHTLHLPAIPRN